MSISFLPPPPLFETGKKIREQLNANRMNDLAQSRVFEVVGGRLEFVPGRGFRITIPNANPCDNRACVVTGETPVSIDGGGVFAFSIINSDVDTTTAAEQVLVELDMGKFVYFQKPGLYLVSYQAVISLDIGGASTHAPGVCEASANLANGGVDLLETISYFGSALLPNLSKFVKTNDTEAVTIQTDVGGATGKTAAFNIASYALSGGGTQNGPTDITFDGSNRQNITLDASQVLDATSNLDKIADYTPSGTVRGTVCGSCLVNVIRDADDSGNLKILDGTTKRDPYLTLTGNRVSAGGSADMDSATLTIQLL